MISLLELIIKILILIMPSLFMFSDDHQETPKTLPFGNVTPPSTKHLDNTIDNEDSKNIKENIVDKDSYGSEDCSAQEYEIMKVTFNANVFK